MNVMNADGMCALTTCGTCSRILWHRGWTENIR